MVLALAMAAWAAQHGHACADLAELEAAVGAEQAERADGEVVPLEWPVRAEWLAALRAAPAVVREADAVDAVPVLDPQPLVVHGERVYLQRYWADESRGRHVAASSALPMWPAR